MTCHIDEKMGTIHSDCCMDYDQPDECSNGDMLHKSGKTKDCCEYWKDQSLIHNNLACRLEIEAEKQLDGDLKKLLIEAAENAGK